MSPQLEQVVLTMKTKTVNQVIDNALNTKNTFEKQTYLKM
jgi:hypothetical protein